ncbi:MAG: hypothetical protein L0H59_00755 [Tomitella sp.]|nr:hypothetical protein [Tomitella sp.]
MVDTQGPAVNQVWAKARTPTDPADIADLHAQTADDRRRYMVEGMTPVACERCANEVLVRKLTAEHTSVQWQSPPTEACPRFAEWARSGEPTALRDGCPDLDSSIVHAVQAGRVEVPDDEGPEGGPADATKD